MENHYSLLLAARRNWRLVLFGIVAMLVGFLVWGWIGLGISLLWVLDIR